MKEACSMQGYTGDYLCCFICEYKGRDTRAAQAPAAAVRGWKRQPGGLCRVKSSMGEPSAEAKTWWRREVALAVTRM